MNLTGTYWILNAMPIWLMVLILDFICVDIFYIGREITEGLPYNISWASQYGDRFLIAIIIIGCLILNREILVPKSIYQLACLAYS